MKARVVATILLLVLCCAGQPASSSLVSQPGDFIIAALLPVHEKGDASACSDELDLQSVVKTEAIKFAIDKLSSDRSFLDGKTLGYDVEDTCGDDAKYVIEKATTLLERHANATPPIAFVMDLPQLLGQLVAEDKLQDIPVLSLSDVPSQRDDVFYLVPGQPRLPNALVALIQKLDWIIVDALVENDKNYQLFMDATKDAKICVGEVYRESSNSTQTAESQTPLLVFADSLDLLKSFPVKFSEGRKVVLVSDGDFQSMKNNENNTASDDVVVLQPKRTELVDFKDHLMNSVRDNASWLAESLKMEPEFRSCGGYGDDGCVTKAVDRVMAELGEADRAIDAVYAIVQALKSSSSKQLTKADLSDIPDTTSLTGNPIRFTKNKDLFRVDYALYKLTEKTLVGSVKTYPEKSETEVATDWDGEVDSLESSCNTTCPAGFVSSRVDGPLAKCCVTCSKLNSSMCTKGQRLNKEGTKCVGVWLDYLRWSHPFSIVLMVVVALFFICLIYFVNVFMKKSHMTAITISPLATLPLLLSLFLTLILPLLPILKPSTTGCNVYVFGFIQALGTPLCILISRSSRVYRRFRQEDGTLKKKCCGGDPQNVIAVVLIIVQLVFSVIILAYIPVRAVYYTTADPAVDYIECSMFNGGEFLFAFFFTIILTIVFSVNNFGAVTREEDTYESHFVALSIFGHYVVSFLFLVVLYGVNPAKLKIILICVLSLLYCVNFFMFIFFPKLYVVVFKRDPASFSPFPLPIRTELCVIGEDEEIISEDK